MTVREPLFSSSGPIKLCRGEGCACMHTISPALSVASTSGSHFQHRPISSHTHTHTTEACLYNNAAREESSQQEKGKRRQSHAGDNQQPKCIKGRLYLWKHDFGAATCGYSAMNNVFFFLIFFFFYRSLITAKNSPPHPTPPTDGKRALHHANIQDQHRQKSRNVVGGRKNKRRYFKTLQSHGKMCPLTQRCQVQVAVLSQERALCLRQPVNEFNYILWAQSHQRRRSR